MQVNQLAKSLATTPDTVRYYTRIGLLNPKKNAANAYKYYDRDDQQRLRFILCARQLGFSVEEIGRILQHAQRGNKCCPQIAALIEQRLEQIHQQFHEALALKKTLATAVSQWRLKPEQAPTGEMLSRLIHEFPTQPQLA